MNDKRQRPVLGVLSGIKSIDSLITTMADVQPGYALNQPCGRASDTFHIGELEGIKVVVLKQHGKHHEYNPTRIPYDSNIYGMKKFGVTHLLLVSPVGSLAEKIHPGRTLFVPDQFIDCTRHRQYTLFPEIAVHVAMDDPVCSTLTANLVDACLKVNDSNVFHPGTLLIMEGPSSPMRAQSRRHLKRGAHAVGMTAIPTAMLAREAQMCFATLCLPETQNHCMTKKKTEARDNLALYGDKPIRVIRKLCRTLRGPNHTDCRCQHALEHAVLTNMHGWTIPPASKDVFRMFGIPLPKLPVR